MDRKGCCLIFLHPFINSPAAELRRRDSRVQPVLRLSGVEIKIAGPFHRPSLRPQAGERFIDGFERSSHVGTRQISSFGSANSGR